MKELKHIIKDLESIFSIVNGVSADAADTLMKVIKSLETFSPSKDLSMKDILRVMKDDPNVLTYAIKELGPTALMNVLLKLDDISDDFMVLSKRIPSLDNYPIEALKALKDELERNSDNPMAKFMLEGLKSNIARREGESV